VLIVSEYIVQFTAARITLVPVKNSSIDQKTLLAVTNVAARPSLHLTPEDSIGQGGLCCLRLEIPARNP
jgi:hypothetical protein